MYAEATLHDGWEQSGYLHGTGQTGRRVPETFRHQNAASLWKVSLIRMTRPASRLYGLVLAACVLATLSGMSAQSFAQSEENAAPETQQAQPSETNPSVTPAVKESKFRKAKKTSDSKQQAAQSAQSPQARSAADDPAVTPTSKVQQSKKPASSGQQAQQTADGSVTTPEGKALTEYNKGVELFQIAQIQRDKGNEPGQKQLLKEAIRHFELALVSNPKMVEAQSNIGFAYLTLRDNRKAISAFEKALTLNPQHLNTLNGLSTAYAFDGKIDMAIQTFDKLTTLDPGNSQYFFNKGSVLQKAGRIDAARAAYEQALKIQPNDQRALFNMGTLLENQGNLEEARPYYEKAKGVEIGNTIGLEAIRRLEAIDAARNSNPSKQP